MARRPKSAHSRPRSGAAAASKDDEQYLIVHRGEHNFILLNLYPYTSGHVMVVPYQHVSNLSDAPDGTLQEMMLLAKEAQRHLGEIYNPNGFNLGMNLGLGGFSLRVIKL